MIVVKNRNQLEYFDKRHPVTWVCVQLPVLQIPCSQSCNLFFNWVWQCLCHCCSCDATAVAVDLGQLGVCSVAVLQVLDGKLAEIVCTGTPKWVFPLTGHAKCFEMSAARLLITVLQYIYAKYWEAAGVLFLFVALMCRLLSALFLTGNSSAGFFFLKTHSGKE